MAFEKAEEGKTTAMICSGDAGVYGMSGLMLEIDRSIRMWKWSAYRE